MPQNVRLTELLGDNFKAYNYMVSSNWRIDFSKCEELVKLIENAPQGNSSIAASVPEQMSFACHSNFQFTTEVEYAEAEVKGMHISQAAWQDRFIESQDIEIYESMDHRIFKALVTAANNTAGYYEHRNINDKKEYTFSGITVQALGNSSDGGEPASELVYTLLGVQINSVESPEYTSDSAEIGSVKLNIRAHGWAIVDGKT